MDLLEGLLTRRSIRRFTDRKVAETDMIDIIKAGMYAPSAGNQQPWRYIIVTDQEKKELIGNTIRTSVMAKDANFVIIVCADLEQAKYPQYWDQDCAAAMQNMLLASHSKGIGAVWGGIYPEKDRVEFIRKEFKIPENIEVFGLLMAGYPEIQPSNAERFHPEMIYREAWEG